LQTLEGNNVYIFIISRVRLYSMCVCGVRACIIRGVLTAVKFILFSKWEYAVTQTFEALSYNTKGRGFDS